MSYSLLFISASLPKTFNAALKVFERLQENDQPALNESAVQQLISDLLQRFPLPGDDANHVWATEPSLRDATRLTLHVEVVHGLPTDVHEEIRRIAREIRFSLLDPQTEVVYLAPLRITNRDEPKSIARCRCKELSEPLLDASDRLKRSQDCQGLAQTLIKVAASTKAKKKLFQCAICKGCIQSGNWFYDARPYFFSVPQITKAEWQRLQYVDPIEAAAYRDGIKQFHARIVAHGVYLSTSDRCRTPQCVKFALTSSVNCLEHHMAALVRAGGLPEFPSGRWFEPYSETNYRAKGGLT
jgi:hypothetical protein